MAGFTAVVCLCVAVQLRSTRAAGQGLSRVKAAESADQGQAVLEAPLEVPAGAQLLATPAEDFSSALLLDSIRQSLIRQVGKARLRTSHAACGWAC